MLATSFVPHDLTFDVLILKQRFSKTGFFNNQQRSLGLTTCKKAPPTTALRGQMPLGAYSAPQNDAENGSGKRREKDRDLYLEK